MTRPDLAHLLFTQGVGQSSHPTYTPAERERHEFMAEVLDCLDPAACLAVVAHLLDRAEGQEAWEHAPLVLRERARAARIELEGVYRAMAVGGGT